MKLLDFSPTLLSPATGARRFAGKSAKLGLGSCNMKHITIGIRRSVEGYQVTIHKAILSKLVLFCTGPHAFPMQQGWEHPFLCPDYKQVNFSKDFNNAYSPTLPHILQKPKKSEPHNVRDDTEALIGTLLRY